MKTAFVALVLALAPAASFATCMGEHVKQQSASCADGYQWNAEKSACETIKSS